ncbi:hypothetical protein [Bacillus sp. ISL-45]|uniref:hypothetical protein n=1 Tax=Bacillus sp. ISL-45 TaxID=2819128 RepID=UPI001BEB58F7|nr:hypothetical protein [Bacillus sp. ISL-45]MBT2660590.1 hypothetical protein [Bacillus sp. ISL-45]
MRKILLAIITLGVLYFIGGFVAVKLNWISSNTYNSYATIVGGVATLCGLITFALPKLTPKDLEILEIQSLERVTKIAEDLNSKKSELNLKETELSKLDKQKKEMEILVIKASTSLFLQDQIKRNESRVLNLINQNKEIIRLLEEIKLNKEKLAALDEEIKNSEQVELLEEIIEKARRNDNKNNQSIVIGGLYPLEIPLNLFTNVAGNFSATLRKKRRR